MRVLLLTRLRAAPAVLALLLGAICWLVPARPSAAFDVEKADQGIVRVFAEISRNSFSLGTGFLIQDPSIIATNNHVIKGGKKLWVGYLVDGKPRIVPVKVVAAFESADLAVLKSDQPLDRLPMPLARYKPGKTSTVYALGYPGTADIVSSDKNLDAAFLEDTVTTGTVSRVVFDTLHGETVVQHNAAINHGNSGGPLVDECGNVVGINTFLPKEASQGIFFAIHASELLRLTQQRSISVSAVVDEPCKPGPPIASREPPASSLPLAPPGSPSEEVRPPAIGTSPLPRAAVPEPSPEEKEAAAFGRLKECLKNTPCDVDRCTTAYSSEVGSSFLEKRKPEISEATATSAPACDAQRAARAFAELDSCLVNSPCRFAEICSPAFMQGLPESAKSAAQTELEAKKSAAEAACKFASAGPNHAARPTGPIQGPADDLLVGVRNYYADLRFNPSPLRDQQILEGNCRDQRVKVTVHPDYSVEWVIKEGTRRSHWSVAVNPRTAEIAISSPAVEVTSPDGGPIDLPAASSAVGLFSKVEITFGPCGTATLIVRD